MDHAREMRRHAIEELVRSGSSVEEAVSIAHGEMFGDAMNAAVTVIEEMERLIEEGTMAGIEMRAPRNPYRTDLREADLGREFGAMAMAGAPPPYSGPGLLGADLDRIARAHHQQGYREGEADQRKHTDEAREQFPLIFDEGYVAGRIERASGLAGDFASRNLAIGFALIELSAAADKKHTTKARIAELAERLHEQWEEVQNFAYAIRDDPAKGIVNDPHVERG